MMKRLVIMAIAMLSLVGCDDREVRGYVVGKQFSPARTTFYYNSTLRTTQIRHIPDQWFIWIADSCRVRSVRVDKVTFDRLRRGQFVSQGDDQW